MNSIKLVLTDMDGTIVPRKTNEVSKAVYDAVTAIKNSGIAIAAVTGRPFEMAQPTLKALGIEGLCVFDGGATIRDAVTGALAWSKWLDVPTLKKIVTIALPYASWIDYKPTWSEDQIEAVDEANIETPAPYVAAALPLAKAEEFVQLINEAVSNVTIHYHIEEENGVAEFQINHAQADKQHGVQALLHLLAVSHKHVLAIGDGSNDFPLFKAAHVKIAMGNASDELKAAADFVVASIDEDGFVEAMNRFVLSQV